jgi:hypothetical protein
MTVPPTPGPHRWVAVPPQQRFPLKIDTSGGPDACHLWTGRVTRNGTGVFRVGKGHHVTAHSYAKFLATGTWCPPGSVPRQTCENRLCCNPAHIVVTARFPRGGLKLTAEQVRELRSRGSERRVDLAAEFGVSRGYAADIIAGRARTDVTD